MKDTQTAIEPLLDLCCQEGLIYRDLSRFTIQWWKKSIATFMKRTGVRFVEELTPATFRQYFYEGRVRHKWTSATYTNYYRALNVFLKWCLKKGLIFINPLEEIERPRPPQRIARSISEEDAQVLLDVSFNMQYAYRFERFRNHAFVAMLVFTGLRLSEALGLGLNDVDLHDNHVFVRSGKWNKDRVVPILPELRRSVTKYLHERERLKKTCPRFFASVRGNTAFTTSGANVFVRRLKKATGITFSAHMLRHTFCTMMANAGTDLLTLKDWMGHACVETTMRYVKSYGHKSKVEILRHPLNR